MFEMAKSVFDEAPPAAEEKARDVVSERLRTGLQDPETEQIVAAVAKAEDVEESTIREEAKAKKEEILARLQSLLESWQRADSNLRQVTRDHEGREREFGFISSRGRLEAFVLFTLVVICAELAIFFLLGTSWNLSGDSWFFQLDRSSRGFWSLAVVLPLLTYQPLHLLLLYRERLRRYFNVPHLESARKAAEERFDFATTNLAAVSIRESINERFTSFSTEFRLLDGRGLRVLADPEREVSTAASEELATLMASLSSGSIGLSGPRGVGKTTLIESFARGRSVPLERERIGLVVSAPVKYDAKEFVLHLFASLCERVLGEERINELQARERVPLHDRRRARLVGALGLGVLLLVGIAAAMLVFGKTAPEGPRETAYVLLAIAALAAYGCFEFAFRASIDWEGLGLGWMARLRGNRQMPLGMPERRALKRLEEIRFQQSISSSVSGSVRLPLGIGVGAESSVTMARIPWSLPEAVEAFRRYAGSLTEENYLVIGIDELDKMGSDASAKEFLNNVKGVFGVNGCYYLVSVSDDAMASFERRGMPVRDVFDSSFDAVQRVDYLTLDESRAVLGSRVVALPIPYQCLCHCLAG
jgi:flagellar biosynthesis GTPase FlhF